MGTGMVQVPFGNTMVTRIAPAMAAQYYKTYSWSAPLSTHWRKGTCEEADCEHYRFGWVTTVDRGTDLGQQQYDYCSHDTSRSFSVQQVSQTLIKIIYKPGNRCFRSDMHRVPLERPPLFRVSGGDFRGNPRGTPRVTFKRPEDWVDDFATHQDKIITAIGRG